jgi:hypothetical protein
MWIVKTIGDAAWWVFVVARLMSQFGLMLMGVPSRYTGLLGSGGGWTSYTPITDRPASLWNDGLYEANALTVIALAGLAVTVVAAVVLAIHSRRWIAGIVTVAAPVIGAAIILFALEQRAGDLGGNMDLPLLVVFVLVLLGVAVRAYGGRALAVPSRIASSDGSQQDSETEE